MADIKTKDNAKGTIRTIDKAAVATQRMKQAYIATKEKAERSVNANSSSAEEYASDKLESGIDEVFHDGAYAFDKAGRKGLETTKLKPQKRISAPQRTVFSVSSSSEPSSL